MEREKKRGQVRWGEAGIACQSFWLCFAQIEWHLHCVNSFGTTPAPPFVGNGNINVNGNSNGNGNGNGKHRTGRWDMRLMTTLIWAPS